MDRVQTAKDSPYFVKLLLYGPPGAGKTTFAAGAPNPVWVDEERSTETFRRLPGLQDIPVFRPANFEEIFQFTRDVVRSKKYDTIVYDTIGRTQDNQVTDLAKRKASPGSRVEGLPLWGDYRISTTFMDEMFMFLQAAPIHVILIAHEKHERNEQGNIVKTTVDLTPTLTHALIGLINVVAYLEEVPTLTGNEKKQRLYVNTAGKIEAKNRLNIQQKSIENPNFKEIFLS